MRKKVKDGKTLAGCITGKEHMITQDFDSHSRIFKYLVSFSFLPFFLLPLSPGHSDFKPDGLERNFF